MRVRLLDLLRSLKTLLLLPFWVTPWGKAVVQMAWEEYKDSDLFRLRARAFGTQMAAKMLTHGEFRYFLDKTIYIHRFNTLLIFSPYTILDKLKEKDLFLKQLVNLNENWE